MSLILTLSSSLTAFEYPLLEIDFRKREIWPTVGHKPEGLLYGLSQVFIL